MTPERIAEIEADGMCTMEDETAELCRLARLGLRVEGAPTARIEIETGDRTVGLSDIWYLMDNDMRPNDWQDKRVALVLLEDSK